MFSILEECLLSQVHASESNFFVIVIIITFSQSIYCLLFIFTVNAFIFTSLLLVSSTVPETIRILKGWSHYPQGHIVEHLCTIQISTTSRINTDNSTVLLNGQRIWGKILRQIFELVIQFFLVHGRTGTCDLRHVSMRYDARHGWVLWIFFLKIFIWSFGFFGLG